MRPSDAPISPFVQAASQIMLFQAQQPPQALQVSAYQTVYNLLQKKVEISDSQASELSHVYRKVQEVRCQQALVSLAQKLKHSYPAPVEYLMALKKQLTIINEVIGKDFDLEKIDLQHALPEVRSFIQAMKEDFPIDKSWIAFKGIISKEIDKLLVAVGRDLPNEVIFEAKKIMDELNTAHQSSCRQPNAEFQAKIPAEAKGEPDVQRKSDIKAAVNSKDSWGNTPLHYALENGNSILAAFYLKMGARLDPCNNEGKTPLQMEKAELLSELTDSQEALGKYANTLVKDDDSEFASFLSQISYTGNNPLQWAVVHQQLGSLSAFHNYAAPQLDRLWDHQNNQEKTVFNITDESGRNVVDLVIAGEALGNEGDRNVLVDDVFARISRYCMPAAVPAPQGSSLQVNSGSRYDEKKLEETVLHKDKAENCPLINAVKAARRTYGELIRMQRRAKLVDEIFADTVRRLHGLLKKYQGEKTKSDHRNALDKLGRVEKSMASLITGEEESLWVSRAGTLRESLVATTNTHRGTKQIAPGFFRSKTSIMIGQVKFDGTPISISVLPSDLTFPPQAIHQDSLFTHIRTAVNSGDVQDLKTKCETMVNSLESASPSLIGITSDQGTAAQNPLRWTASLIEKYDLKKRMFAKRLEAYKKAFAALEGYLLFAEQDVFFGRDLIKKRLKLVQHVREKILEGQYANIEAAVKILKDVTDVEVDAEGKVTAAQIIAGRKSLMAQQRISIPFWRQSPTYSEQSLNEITQETQQIALTA